MEISGHTRMLCLIGSPVGHSGSPAMYNYSFRKLGIDYAYLAYDIKEEETAEAVKALRLLNVRGFNITMPCKTAALACCDELSKAAELIGAVNTVVNENGRLIGHNTDGLGWVRNCRENGFEIKGKKMTIAGSGGAATAIEITCALEGIREMSIFALKDSFFANAEATVEKIRAHVPGCRVNLYDLADKETFYKEIGSSDIFTNATRVGMKPMDDQSLVEDTGMFRKDLVVSDVVYNPRTTKLLADAKAAGCRTIPGIGMLLWQGAEAFKLYTGQEMPAKEVMEKYFSE
ncbi:shikimate dehydrogenase [Lacrimispora sp. 210928-DFI.3.58]|uniref:shikimate dehydrogenase n=1 Tax=Lacrimispora sp. 210928-DFI.3.58 TaxID=2883214 RepID=UPI001D0850A6|nr:shikimate dehydrogenase [Lacrimispora sp. 210928-DFI.3.58]MCB7319486.1 shikimate dehydrogenase [Lacrimispora sp. 210928-DFI.3.58]